jgi:hypothetical protein
VTSNEANYQLETPLFHHCQSLLHSQPAFYIGHQTLLDEHFDLLFM